MPAIKESKSFSFGNKILKINDLDEFAQILNNEYSKKDKDHCCINFTLICEDGTSYESTDIGIFSPKSIINSKKPSKVELWFSNYESDEKIRVVFKKEYRKEFSENSFSVEGYDSNWVNGIFGRILEKINSIEPQNPNKRLYLNLIHFGSAILIGRFFTFFILLILGKPDESQISEFILLIRRFVHMNVFTYDLSIYIVSFCVGFLPAFLVRDYFAKLWPYLEFQIGPPHELEEKRKRGKLKNLIILIVIPLFLAILYDALKYFI